MEGLAAEGLLGTGGRGLRSLKGVGLRMLGLGEGYNGREGGVL